jgi:DNA-binding NarL/FixJ family response regulator
MLTPSERRVMHHAAHGMTDAAIAAELWLSEKTVKAHLGNSYRKLGVRQVGSNPRVLAVLAFLEMSVI